MEYPAYTSIYKYANCSLYLPINESVFVRCVGTCLFTSKFYDKPVDFLFIWVPTKCVSINVVNKSIILLKQDPQNLYLENALCVFSLRKVVYNIRTVEN